MGDVAFTMLSQMADRDFERALDRHVDWGLRHLDLKGGIFRKDVTSLTDEEADQVREMADTRGLSVYCLSTTLFDTYVEEGADVFADTHLSKLDRLIAVAERLSPAFVRLLAAKSRKRTELADAIAYVRDDQAWLLDQYREAIDRLSEAGQRVTIENECHDCLLSNPEETHAFFDAIDRGDRVSFTWDVQNMWQMGTFPTLAVYEELKPLIAYYHVKGGQSESPGGPLKWRSGLADASWPVREITARVVADGVSPVICLNASHGERREGVDYAGGVEEDMRYLREVSS